MAYTRGFAKYEALGITIHTATKQHHNAYTSKELQSSCGGARPVTCFGDCVGMKLSSASKNPFTVKKGSNTFFHEVNGEWGTLRNYPTSKSWGCVIPHYS